MQLCQCRTRAPTNRRHQLADAGSDGRRYVSDDGAAVIHELGVEAGLAQAAHELARPGIAIDDVVLQLDNPSTTAEMLLDYADRTECDVILAGSARLGRLDRWIMGSVSTDLVRDGSHSLLIVPP